MAMLVKIINADAHQYQFWRFRMKYTTITGSGNHLLTIGETTQSPEVTIYLPTTMGTAVVNIGYLDKAGVARAFTDGLAAVNTQKRIRCGVGVQVVAMVLAHNIDFDIGFAE